MLTFLPFLRAVKAPARSLGVCAAIVLDLASGCAAPSATSHWAGPPTGPLPVPLTAATGSAPSTEPASSTPGVAIPEPAPQRPSSVRPAPVALSLELPYPLDARPRASNALQAAAEDEALARWNAGGSADPSAPSSQASYHPGTRVVVDTRPAKLKAGAKRRAPVHGLTLDRVQAQARSKGYWPFRLCFEVGQREKKGSGGETKVAFSIGIRGNVRAARLLDSQLLNAKTAECMVRELRRLQFTPRPPTVLAMVASIRVYPGDAELPAGPASPASNAAPALAGTPLVSGAFDANATRAAVSAKQAPLDACFEDARRNDPGLWGRLALGVVLEMDGSVHRVNEVESHFPSAAATRCAEVLVSSIVFPSVNGKPYSFVVALRLAPSPNAQEKTGPEEAPSPSDAPDPGAASDAPDAGATDGD